MNSKFEIIKNCSISVRQRKLDTVEMFSVSAGQANKLELVHTAVHKQSSGLQIPGGYQRRPEHDVLSKVSQCCPKDNPLETCTGVYEGAVCTVTISKTDQLEEMFPKYWALVMYAHEKELLEYMSGSCFSRLPLSLLSGWDVVWRDLKIVCHISFGCYHAQVSWVSNFRAASSACFHCRHEAWDQGCDGSPTTESTILGWCQSRSRVELCWSETRMVIWFHISDLSATVLSGHVWEVLVGTFVCC